MQLAPSVQMGPSMQNTTRDAATRNIRVGALPTATKILIKQPSLARAVAEVLAHDGHFATYLVDAQERLCVLTNAPRAAIGRALAMFGGGL